MLNCFQKLQLCQCLISSWKLPLLSRQADALELDETFRSVDDDVDYPSGRLEEADQTKMAYAKVRLEAKKMKKVISVPIEDEIRSQFNMMSLEQENLKFAFFKEKKRASFSGSKKDHP